MLRTVRDMLLGAFVAAMVGYVFASNIGVTPNPAGFQMIDGQWLIGLAQGNNLTYQSGITAAGTGASTATVLNPNIYLNEVDTVASSTGIALPFAIVPDITIIRNNGSNPLNVYANAGTNAATGTTDTVNGGSSVTVNQNKSALCFVAKNGVYSCMLSS